MNAPDDRIFPISSRAWSKPASEPSSKPFVIMYHGSIVERNGLDLAVDALALSAKGDSPRTTPHLRPQYSFS